MRQILSRSASQTEIEQIQDLRAKRVVAEPPIKDKVLAQRDLRARPGLLLADFDTVLDSRTQLTGEQLRQLPYSAIGYITVRFPTSTHTGTGFLIDPGIVITAAHVLFDPSEGFGRLATFTPGCYADGIAEAGSGLPPNSQFVDRTRMRIRDGWSRTNTSIALDYAAIFLPNRTMFKDCGYLQIQSLADSLLELYTSSDSIEFQIAGFPFEKPKGSQWFGRGLLRSADLQAIRYYIGTTAGQSGSPLFGFGVSRSTGKKIPIVIGIHSRFEEDFNIAHRIDQRFLADLARWKEEFARIDQVQIAQPAN